MIVENLYDKVLRDPVKNGASELFIVSGYSSATFCRRHLIDLCSLGPDTRVKLIIGMSQKKRDHSAYLGLIQNFTQMFEGYYYQGRPEVHVKAYAWFSNKAPSVGFSGSANYSQAGFFREKQQNQMNQDDPQEIYSYFQSLLSESIAITDYEIQDDEKNIHQIMAGSLLPGEIEWIVEDKSVRISLLARNGELSKKSGLNWGQRPGRDRNQAYLTIRSDARKEGFLPDKGFTFTLITDDNETLDCTVQQDGRKAISTTNDNSRLGKYFRNRLGVESEAMVTKDDLKKYGRTDFVLRKLDEETFFLDFCKPA